MTDNLLTAWTRTHRFDATVLANQLSIAANTAHQIRAQMDDLEEKRQSAEMAAAVAHASLDTLIQQIGDDTQAAFLSRNIKQALSEARDTCQPERWERLLEQFRTMHHALTQIAQSPNDDRPQLIARGALADINV